MSDIHNYSDAIVPVLRNRGVGDVFPYFADTLERVIARKETNDALSVLRLSLTPDGATPLHRHSREDEIWIVLDGEVKFWTGGNTLAECDRGTVKAGGVAYGPRNIPHTFQTFSERSEVLILMTPGMFEDHMLAIGDVANSKESNSEKLVEEFGITILDRPPVYGKD